MYSLQAGDLISMGTPAGVGHGAKPPRYLQPGDVVEMGIERLGIQRHVVTEWKAGGGRARESCPRPAVARWHGG